MKYLFLFFLSLNSFALTIENQEIPESFMVAGKTLVLNGYGIRKATVFKVKVYVGVLYLEKKNENPLKIVDSAEQKSIRLVFVRDLDAEKVRGAFTESLERSLGKDKEKYKDKIEDFSKSFSAVKKGEQIEFMFRGSTSKIVMKGEETKTFDDEVMTKAIQNIWLGSEPVDEKLKAGMLGKI